MRYIGGKSLLTDYIGNAIRTYAPDVAHVTDIFAGSGAVASYLLNEGYSVTTNDFLYFSFVLCRGTIGLKSTPRFRKLGIKDPISFLNQLKTDNAGFPHSLFFITNNYSPEGNSGRMYFQPKNALKIDIIRLTIEKWRNNGLLDDDEYFYLLAALINAVPYVSNIAGVYAAYLKHWDPRTFKDLTLTTPATARIIGKCRCLNLDYRKLHDIGNSLLYADPPYNQREYCPNYHILETIARYDYPQIHGVTGLRPYRQQKSPFCSQKTVTSAFNDLIADTSARYILISYNNEGLLSTDRLTELCLSYARPKSFHLTELPYRRYKNKIPNNATGLKELLFFFEKK